MTHNLVVRSRYVKAQRFVRPFEVVDLAPSVEALLAIKPIPEILIAQHFGLERAMKA